MIGGNQDWKNPLLMGGRLGGLQATGLEHGRREGMQEGAGWGV